MIRRLLTICILLSMSGGIAAAPATQSSQAKTPATTAGKGTTTANAGETEKKLQPPTNEKRNVKTVMNQAIKVFVPSEKIDVDKPVDFPTNI